MLPGEDGTLSGAPGRLESTVQRADLAQVLGIQAPQRGDRGATGLAHQRRVVRSAWNSSLAAALA